MGWRLCHICQYYAPPRSFHCKICKACILRQDHHCFFAAGCIGQFTTFYFVTLCLWLMIGQLVVLYCTFLYVKAEALSWFSLFPPTSLWVSLTGSQPWFNFLFVVMATCAVLNLAICTFYLLMSTYAATDNVTFHEGSKGIKTFNRGSVVANVRAAWGCYYWIRWLLPFYAAPDGNGYDWKVRRHLD